MNDKIILALLVFNMVLKILYGGYLADMEHYIATGILLFTISFDIMMYEEIKSRTNLEP